LLNEILLDLKFYSSILKVEYILILIFLIGSIQATNIPIDWIYILQNGNLIKVQINDKYLIAFC